MSRPAAGPLNVGVIGLGYWGPNLLRVLADDVDVEVSWICDRDPERLARLHRRCPAARPTEQFEAVLEDTAVTAVVIATPVASHFALAAASLSAGNIGYAVVPIALADPGTTLEVDAPGGRVAATVVTMPLIDPQTELPRRRLSTET